LRPRDRQNVEDRSEADDITGREIMEASENAGPSRQGNGGPALHRIDPDRVASTLSSGSNPAGLARLDLMVNTIFGRLVAAGGREHRR
jgi:hypothetical protein